LYSATPWAREAKSGLGGKILSEMRFPTKNIYVRIAWRVLNDLLVLYGVFLCVRWLVVNLYHGNEVKVAAWLVILYAGARVYIEIRNAMSKKTESTALPSEPNQDTPGKK